MRRARTKDRRGRRGLRQERGRKDCAWKKLEDEEELNKGRELTDSAVPATSIPLNADTRCIPGGFGASLRGLPAASL
jgi:hypothetical protein